ncbi:MAG: TlpA family protein disulfide reductase [Planctomycetes bacterium]|nr:TlpA family protein disulfide reductase [Planctomycetota bacterium]
MVHLDETYAKYKDKGLVVIGITNEPRGLVDKFVAETGAKHVIVMESGDSGNTYKIKGYPSSFLIDVNGKIVGTSDDGGVNDGAIEAQLQKVLLPPKLPAKLAAVQALLDKRKYADARKLLDKAAADEKATEDDRKAATDAIAWMDEAAKRRMASAAADATAGEYPDAAETYTQIGEQWKGLPAADDAAAALKDLLADPAKKKEIDAAAKFDDVRARIAELKPKKAIPVLRGFLSNWKGTKAGSKAEAILKELEVQANK